MPTRKQKRVAEILAEDKDIPVTKALVKAGYAKTTAYKAQSIILDSPGTKRAIAEIEAERSDSARELKRRGLREALKRLESGEATDQLVLGSVKIGHEVAQDEPPANADYDEAAHRARLRRFAYRCWTAGFRACERQHNLREKPAYPPKA